MNYVLNWECLHNFFLNKTKEKYVFKALLQLYIGILVWEVWVIPFIFLFGSLITFNVFKKIT